MKKSFKTFQRTIGIIFNHMTKEEFWCQSSYGNTTRFKFFYTHNNHLVTALGTIDRANQEIFMYDQRPFYMIRSD